MGANLRIGSLCSGIGGLELGLERAGVGHTVWHVEQDAFCRAVLAKHWPDAKGYEDVREVGARNLDPVDVVCFGFPCQGLSVAGRGAGLKDPRSALWFECLRVVRELGPRCVVIENVPALLGRGLDIVLEGLTSAGYQSEWSLVRAVDVGAPHKRARIFILAWRAVADAAQLGLEKPITSEESHELPPAARGCDAVRPARERKAASRVAVGNMGRTLDGVSGGVDRSWPAGRGAAQLAWEPPRVTAHERNRTPRLKALGNAVVPACAEVAGRRLLEILTT